VNREYQMYINGMWVNAVSGTLFDDYNPYTEEVYARVASARGEDARLAIQAAAEVFPSWSRVPPSDKRMFFLKAVDILERRSEEYAMALAERPVPPLPLPVFRPISARIS
jgi:acyl-CoA reductase-like NAD-dependent aldehyde dehydrogenase